MIPAFDSQEKVLWSTSDWYWRQLRSTLERLRTSQLRPGSLYANVRTLVPVLVMGLTWLWIWQSTGPLSINRMYGRSVTIRHLFLAITISALWNLWLGLTRFSSRSLRADLLGELSRLAAASQVASLPLLIGNLTRGLLLQGLILAGVTAFGLMMLSYLVLTMFVVGAVLYPRMSRKKPALIVGTGPRSDVLRKRLSSLYSPYQLFGTVDNRYCGNDTQRDHYLGDLATLPALLKNNPIEIVLIGLPIRTQYDDIQQVIRICESVGVESHYMGDVFETSLGKTHLSHDHRSQFAVLSVTGRQPTLILKRLVDIVGSLLLLLLLSPVILVATLAIRLMSKGPIFFVQQRYGLHRKRFPMLKFRSMVMNAEKLQSELESKNEATGPVFKMSRDPRVTRVGSFLRKTSIDEIPQLINVLRGEMSLVGPRPLPLRDVTRFEEPWLLRRFSVRPGITCLWQISGRSNTSFDDWMKQDLTYIDEWSLWLDLKILCLTIPAVFYGRGAV